MDITSITSLISTFRAETHEEAITPESLGALLQKIADALGTASLQTDVAALQSWRTGLAKIGNVLTALSVGSDDRNNVYLSFAKTSLTSAASQMMNDGIVIRQATTERAGAMRAQQVQDLNKCKSDVSALNTSLTTATRSITALQNAITALSNRVTTNAQGITSNDTDILTIQTDIKSLATQIKSLQTDILKYATMTQATQMHIECIITDDQIVVQDAYRYVRQGLTPVIFRHSVRTSRKAADEDGYREPLPTRRGWNRFYDDGKLRVNASDIFSFRVDTQGASNRGDYITSADALFSHVRIVRDKSTQKVERVMVGFGSRTYNILYKERHFRFAIGFYKKSSSSPTFQFSELRTNLTEFRVIVEAYLDNGEPYIYINYSR